MGLGIEEIIGSKKQDILALAKVYNVGNIRVFGSVVRNEADKDSDVDFLVDISRARFREYMGFYHKLCAMFDRKVDMISDRSLNSSMSSHILAEARPL